MHPSTRLSQLAIVLIAAAEWLCPRAVGAQDETPPASRAAIATQAQAEKAAKLQPYKPNKAEEWFERVEARRAGQGRRVHPFFGSAYSGGGFTLGAGYAMHVSPYNVLDFRGSYTVNNYKKLEAALLAPRVFDRRGTLLVLGGWREATQVGFYGFGTEQTSRDDRANYAFDQPYASAALDLRPMRNMFVVLGGLEVSQWNQKAGQGNLPSVDEVYTADTLPGLGSSPAYLHTHAGVGLDWRDAPGYSRRGGAYTVTFHDYRDRDGQFGFRRTEYDAVQHFNILRDSWVLSLHGSLDLANAANAQTIPFFMLPSLGGGSSLRGFSSTRFRDLNSLLLQAEWRVLANSFLDVALLYDAGRVSARRSDLVDGPFKSDYGVGLRLHSAIATPLRIEFVKSNEGLNLVFSTKAAF